VEQDGERGGVCGEVLVRFGGVERAGRTGGEDNDLGDTAVEGLGDFVGALLELVVVRRLLDEIEDGGVELGVGQGPGGCAGVSSVSVLRQRSVPDCCASAIVDSRIVGVVRMNQS
jgi:hypothetical protein